MTDASCPHCRADLSETDRSGAHCPYCGEMLPDALRLRPADETGRVSYGRSEEGSLALRPLPPKSRLEVIEATDRRLVVFVPAGGSRSAGLGCFALIWNGFMTVFSTVMIGAALQEKQPGPALGMIGFSLLFWAVGLGILYAWLRLRFTRWTLLVEPERAALQKIFLGRRSVEEAALPADCRAELVEVYKQNDVPVHAVAIPGEGRTLKFGTALSDEEKTWLVDAIDACLTGGAPRPRGTADGGAEPGLVESAACPECGTPWSAADDVEERKVRHCSACGHEMSLERLAPPQGAAYPFDDLDPQRLPAASVVRITEDASDRLAFELPLVPKTSTFRKVGVAMLISSVVEWIVVAGIFVSGYVAGQGNVAWIAIGLVFAAVGLVPAGIGIAVLRGRTSVDVRRDTTFFRWGVGSLGMTRGVVTAAIDSVSVPRGFRRIGDSRSKKLRPEIEARVGTGDPNTRFCEVRAGSRTYIAAFAHDPTTTAEVAGLIRARARRYGARIPNE